MSIASEKIALHKLALRGYRIHHGAVWYIADDDPDRGLDEIWIGDWQGSAEDAYLTLMEHEWPVHMNQVFCRECHEGEVYFGELCAACNRRLTVETRGDLILDVRRGK